MSTSRPFSYYNGYTPLNTDKYGNILVGLTGVSLTDGGLSWFNGPDEDLGYVIAHDGGTNRTYGNNFGPIAGTSIGFWRSVDKTDNSFLNIAANVGQTFSSASNAKTWLESNGHWTSYVGGISTDPDAVTFFTAAAITDTTQRSAINKLVLDFKSYGVWSKMIGIYLHVGGIQSSAAVNLKTPGTYNLTFYGTVLASHFTSGGTSPGYNAGTGAGRMYWSSGIRTPNNVSKSNFTIGVYLNANAGANTGKKMHFGYLENNTESTYMHLYTQVYSKNAVSNSNSAGGQISVNLFPSQPSAIEHQGFWAMSRRSTSDFALIGRSGGITKNTITESFTGISAPIVFAARVSDQFPAGPTPLAANIDTLRHAFDFVSTGLNDTELANVRTAVIEYQTTLGRSVG